MFRFDLIKHKNSLFKPGIEKIVLSIFGLCLILLLLPISGHGANFKQADNLDLESNSKDWYVAGNKISVKQNIDGDINILATEVVINTPQIEDNLQVLASDINIHTENAESSVKLIAGKIVLSGHFKKDVLLLGNNIKIQNAVIDGDLVVGSNILEIRDSQVLGNTYLSYKTIKNWDLRQSYFAGKLDIYEIRQADIDRQFWVVRFGVEISTFIGLLFLLVLLTKTGKLEVSKQNLNESFTNDLFVGIAILLLPVIGLLLSLFVQLYFLFLALSGLIFTLLLLSNLYLPIYIANYLRNNGLKFRTDYFSVLIYIIAFFATSIPILKIASGLVLFTFIIASYGFLWRQLFSILKPYLINPNKLENSKKTVQKSKKIVKK